LSFIETASRFVVDILDAGCCHFEASAAQQPGSALIVAVQPLALIEKTKTKNRPGLLSSYPYRS
jgi:hypothetical protein